MPVISSLSDTHDKLIPPLLRGFRDAWRYQTPLNQTITTDVNGMKGVRGEVVLTDFPEGLNVQDVVPSSTLPAGEDHKWYQKEITLSEWKEVRFKFNDRVIADGTGSMAIQAAIKSAATALANYLNGKILDELRVTGNILTTTNTPISSYSDVIAINKKLSMRTPTKDRILIFGRDSEALLLAQPQFLELNYQAKPSNITHGVIGQRLGFDFMPIDIPTNTMVQEIPGVFELTGVSLMRSNRDSTCIAQLAAALPNKSFHKGNVIEIFEVDGTDITTLLPLEQRIVTVSKDADANQVNVPLEFRVGHDFAGDNFTTFTSLSARMLKVLDEGIGYTREAVTMVMRPSETLGFSSGRASVYDKSSQIAMTLERERGHKLTFFNVDILFGLAHLQPSYSARQVQIDPANMYVTP